MSYHGIQIFGLVVAVSGLATVPNQGASFVGVLIALVGVIADPALGRYFERALA